MDKPSLSNSEPPHEPVEIVIQLMPRTPEYWHSIRDRIEARVNNFSRELEERARWNGPQPWVDFGFDWNPEEVNASISRQGNQATIKFSLGLLIWLDDAAQWMNRDILFRDQLNIASMWGAEDFSQLMITLWTEWILCHEIGHFFCGHLSNGCTQWTEFEPRHQSDILLIQAQEFDADMFAASLFFRFLQQCLVKSIYQECFGYNDIGDLFWDIGMLFAGIFVAFEHQMPLGSARTHPEIVDRLKAFVINGICSFQRAACRDVGREYSALLKGMTQAFFLIDIEGAGLNFGKQFIETHFDPQPWRNRLLNAKMDKRRLLALPDDWLLR